MSLRDTLKQLEEERLVEADVRTGAIEKLIGALGYGAGKFKKYGDAARARITRKPANPAAPKVDPAATTPKPTTPSGYTPAKPDATAIAGLNAEQKQLSDFFANPKNHVTKDGKVWGRDPKNVGEFVELDAKTFLPKGQIGINRPAYYAPGALNRELQALEKLGPKEIAELEAKAMASKSLSAAEKAEVKNGGIIAWIKKNPNKAKTIGVLGAVAALGVAGQMGGEQDIAALPSSTAAPVAPVAPVTPTNPAPAGPSPLGELIGQVDTLIADLEKSPECKQELDALKAEYSKIVPEVQPDPKWTSAIEQIKTATGKSDQEIKGMVYDIRSKNSAITPEEAVKQLAVKPVSEEIQKLKLVAGLK
jgi:hypothetical protein